MDGWIVIPNWDKFQHYKNRQPVWIKLYTELAHDEDWLELDDAERGALVRIWIEYALSRRALRTKDAVKNMSYRRAKRTLSTLQKAGFIQVSASRPASTDASPEKRREEKTPTREAGEPEKLEFEKALTPRQAGTNPRAQETNPRATGTNPRELARYTGCRWVKGTHSSSWVQDPLGTDKPPDDWPYQRPSKDEILLHLEIQDR